MQAPWSQTSSLQNSETINACCLSRPTFCHGSPSKAKTASSLLSNTVYHGAWLPWCDWRAGPEDASLRGPFSACPRSTHADETSRPPSLRHTFPLLVWISGLLMLAYPCQPLGSQCFLGKIPHAWIIWQASELAARGDRTFLGMRPSLAGFPRPFSSWKPSKFTWTCPVLRSHWWEDSEAAGMMGFSAASGQPAQSSHPWVAFREHRWICT